MLKPKFYTYVQNNSWGVFSAPAGVLVVQAENLQAADKRAEELGVYFNGLFDGTDCCCCGSRWKRAEEGFDDIRILEMDLEQYCQNINFYYRSRRCRTFKIPTILIDYNDKQKSNTKEPIYVAFYCTPAGSIYYKSAKTGEPYPQANDINDVLVEQQHPYFAELIENRLKQFMHASKQLDNAHPYYLTLKFAEDMQSLRYEIDMLQGEIESIRTAFRNI